MNTDSKSFITDSSKGSLRRIDIKTVLGHDREVIICHRNEEYRLRLTSNDKLILTK